MGLGLILLYGVFAIFAGSAFAADNIDSRQVQAEVVVDAGREAQLQAKVSSMTCSEAKIFIRNNYLADEETTDSTAAVLLLLADQKDDCHQARAFIYEHIRGSLTSGKVYYKSQPKSSAPEDVTGSEGLQDVLIPPYECIACAASQCQDHDLCLNCCFAGFEVFCYHCPS